MNAVTVVKYLIKDPFSGKDEKLNKGNHRYKCICIFKVTIEVQTD